MEPDVIFINEDDWRNADRRTSSAGQPPPVVVGRGQYVRPNAPPSAPAAAASTGGAMWVPGVGYQHPSMVGQPSQPMVIYRPSVGADPRSVLGKLTASDLATLAGQILGAIQPLPGAPVATGDVETDIANLTEYQAALAAHAKRDEQVRTLGNLVSKLLG